MAISRNRDLASSLGQAVKRDQITIAGGLAIAGVTAYDSADLLPTSYDSSNAGSLGFAKDSDRLYIHTGQGWFNIAIVNTTPIFTTSPAASYTLASDATAYKNGTATTITIQARDSEGFPVTYAATGNTAFNNMAHVDKDSAAGYIFTIEPKSQDSAGSAIMPTGTLTFTATDGINIASAISSFELTFDTSVSNSEETALSIRGVGDNTSLNAGFDDVSDANHTLVVANGSPYLGTFSPYNSAGYSLYVNASNDYVRTVSNGNASSLGGTGNFTVEAWVYRTADAGNAHHDIVMSTRDGTTMNSGGWDLYLDDDTDGFAGFQWNNPSAGSIQQGTVNNNRWHHIAACKVSGTTTLYVDGVAVGTGSPGNLNETGKVTVGGFSGGSYRFNGYICDARVVAGTAVYTANFTPPTEPLTAISGTNFLLGAKGITRDGSSNNHAMLINGTPEMIPFTPYKHQIYDASKYGGSVYMDGTDNFSTSGGSGRATSGGAAWTLEFWMYQHSSGDQCLFDFRSGGNGIIAELNGDGKWWSANGGNTNLSTYNDTTYGNIKTKTWYHIAFVHTGSAFTYYKNGIAVSTTSQTSGANVNGTFYIGSKTDSSKKFIGNITDFRFVNGKAVYTGAFTPPSGPLTKTGGTYPSATNIVNPTASETKFLMNNVEGNIIDLSGTTNIEPNGNAQSDTGVQKYSVPSILFDGTGDFLSIPYSDVYAPGAENYTAECWIYTATDNQTQPLLMGMWNGSSNYSWALQLGASTSMYPRFLIWDGSSYNDNPATTKITMSAWNHIAVARNGNLFTLFLNGVSVKTATITGTAATVNTPLTIGATSSGGQTFTGNISDARFTKISRYPFIPLKETMTTSTSFQATTTASNVKLLAAHTSTLATNGGNSGTAITVQAGSEASAFAPIGGMRSAYFDEGSDAPLVHTAAALGAGVFTIECWAYITKTSAYDPIFGIVPFANRNTSSAYRLLYVGGNNNLSWWNTTDFVTTPNNSVPNDEWHHLAVTRESDNKIRLYINGGMAGESGSTYTEDLSTFDRIYLGRHNTVYYEGYISNARITTQVLYTKNFTVPSIALTG